ncbi:MAG: hypothetical protein HYT63_00540 [Candidatus Yanofskybacteria bacterium]|nr:hypothetical protein [Candidatus Yanofskybacteria bacterium]
MHIKKGLAMHVHHEKFVEWCFDYDKRAEFIRTEKPPEERETRLRLFKLFKGELPPGVVEAGLVYDEARQAYDKAYQVYDKAHWTFKKAYLAYIEARRVFNKANLAYSEAWQVYDEILNKNMPAIEALHRIECPNCPWDGHTIFPKT